MQSPVVRPTEMISAPSRRSTFGAISLEVLRVNWRQMVYWGGGIAVYAFFLAIIVPNADVLKMYSDIVESLPSFLVEAMGGSDAAFMATPQGYIAVEFFSWIILVFALYAVIAGLNVSAAEEDAGILDVLLSLPLPRWRVIVEKLLAYGIMLTGIVIITLIGLWLGVLAAGGALDLTFKQAAESVFNLLPASLLVLAVTALIGTIARRRSRAAAWSGVFVMGSYFLTLIANAARGSFADQLVRLSLFTYYDHVGTIQHGLSPSNVAGLLLATLAAAGAGIWFFQRRDIGV